MLVDRSRARTNFRGNFWPNFQFEFCDVFSVTFFVDRSGIFFVSGFIVMEMSMAASLPPPRCLSDREANIKKGWRLLTAEERLRARLEVRKAIQAAEPAMAAIVLGDSPYLCALRSRRAAAAACGTNAVLVMVINVGMFRVLAP